MISVVLGAAIALVGALAVIAVDWERLCAFVRIARGRHAYIAGRSYVNAMAVERFDELPGPVDVTRRGLIKIAQLGDVEVFDLPTVCSGDGFKVLADDSLAVTAKLYANGSTQVWLRKAS